MVRSEGRIQALGGFHIGGVAYCVWLLPPMSGELRKGTDKPSDSAEERAASWAAEKLKSTGKYHRRSGHWRGGKASRT